MTFGLLANAVANSVKGVQVLRKGYQQLSAGSSDVALRTQYLTQEELEKLDSYEINYRKELLECILIQKNHEKEEKINCIVYVSNDNTWVQPPSQQYLTAIKVMLEGCHNQSCIIISGFIDDKLTNLEKWSFDKNINNLSLESLFVLINSKKEKPWIMPKTLGYIIKKLNAINIYDRYDLIKDFEYLNNKLQEKNYNTFSEETCRLINDITKLEQKDSNYLII
jgi:hypothetical protein